MSLIPQSNVRSRLDVVVAEKTPQVPIAVTRRIADDYARGRPGDLQGIARLDTAQILERQRALGEVEFIDCFLVCHPQRQPRQMNCERLDLDPADVLHLHRKERTKGNLVLGAKPCLLAQLPFAVV